LAMAPDSSSAQAARALAVPRKWQNLGANLAAAWGECQGSGALPYQTRLDFQETAFKCTCPSRKFPCKHSLALLIMLVQQPDLFVGNQPPAWVAEWLTARQSRAEKKARKAEEGDKPVDAVAQAKRQEQRKAKVDSGVAELDRFLQDIVRQGLALLQNKPYSFWEEAAARLVDAQAAGLARMLRECAGIASTGEGWHDRLLAKLAGIHLLTQAYMRMEQLPAELQQEVRTRIGYTVDQESLLKLDGIRDRWEVVGQKIEQEDRLRVQRTWLKGEEKKKWALVLSFAHGTAPLDNSLAAGTAVDAELAFVPGAYPLRAIVKSKVERIAQIDCFYAVSFAQGLADYAAALSRNPWIERFPMAFADVVPVRTDDRQWSIKDSENNLLPLSTSEALSWQLCSVSGGRKVSLFGEWDGLALAPLSVSTGSDFYRFDRETAG
ncbi:MAG TPA: SWIM zinc finger family protein, partial [Chroococcales cyanobacterium]